MIYVSGHLKTQQFRWLRKSYAKTICISYVNTKRCSRLHSYCTSPHSALAKHSTPSCDGGIKRPMKILKGLPCRSSAVPMTIGILRKASFRQVLLLVDRSLLRAYSTSKAQFSPGGLPILRPEKGAEHHHQFLLARIFVNENWDNFSDGRSTSNDAQIYRKFVSTSASWRAFRHPTTRSLPASLH